MEDSFLIDLLIRLGLEGFRCGDNIDAASLSQETSSGAKRSENFTLVGRAVKTLL